MLKCSTLDHKTTKPVKIYNLSIPSKIYSLSSIHFTSFKLGSNQEYASYTYILTPKCNQLMLFPWKREHISSAHLIIGINYHSINFQPIRGRGDCLHHNGIGPILGCITWQCPKEGCVREIFWLGPPSCKDFVCLPEHLHGSKCVTNLEWVACTPLNTCNSNIWSQRTLVSFASTLKC